MTIFRYEIASGMSPVVMTMPEGTGSALVRVDIETSRAEAERADQGNTLHQRDIVVNAVRKILQHILNEK